MTKPGDQSPSAPARRVLVAMNRLPLVVSMIDPDGRLLLSEGGGLELLGLQPGEAVGLNALEMFDHVPLVRRNLERAIAGEEVRYEAELPGGIHFIGVYLPELAPDGSVKSVLTLGWDVSDRVRAERAMLVLLQEKERLLQQLRERVAQREILLRELQHRVKNNLQVMTSMVQLRLGSTQSDETVRLLDEFQGRLQTLGVTHDLLHDGVALEHEGFKQVAHQVGSSILDSFGVTERVSLTVDTDQSTVVADEAMPLTLALHELIVNAVSHAFPQGRAGTITVRFVGDETGRTLLVEDDGVGLAERGPHPGVGTRLVAAFARRLGGAVHWQSQGAGTRCALTLPPRPLCNGDTSGQ